MLFRSVHKELKLGPVTVKFYELPPIRCYYLCRNTLYFALYESDGGRFALFGAELWRVFPSPEGRGVMNGVAWQVLSLTLNFLLRPLNHGGQILACFRGIWHGLTGNIAARH